MTKIETIKKAIKALPEDEYILLRRWFADRDWTAWDRQISRDSASGKLDFLIRDADDDKQKGNLKDL
jgi:hypothetical protein